MLRNHILKFFLVLIVGLNFTVISGFLLAGIPDHKPLISEVYGMVWFDTNANGMIDSGENGLGNVQVILYTCSGQLIQTYLTDGDGSYYFGNIPDGNYKIYIEKNSLPNDYSFTLLNFPDTDNQTGPNGYSDCFDVFENEYSVHGGFTILSDIGNYVWEDLNGNGIQDSGEQGIADVVVRLLNDTGSILVETTSNSMGEFFFNHVFPGFYYLEFEHDSIWIPSSLHTGNLFVDNNAFKSPEGNTITETFQVIPGLNRMDIDAGFYKCAKVCGTVFWDNNTNDNLDIFENGINGLSVYLWEKTDEGIELYDFTTTQRDTTFQSKDGNFVFCVPPGTYYVSLTIPPGVDLVLGLPFNGDSYQTSIHFDETNGALTTYDLNLESGDEQCYLNAGLYCSSKITNNVWLDTDYNGLKDESEPAISGVIVEIFDQFSNKLGEVITDQNGKFLLDSLRKGLYYLAFSKPENLTYTLPENDGGILSDIDSDVSEVFGPGTTSLFFLEGCDTLQNISAGYSFAALPLNWLDFYALVKEKANQLLWTVQSSENSYQFEVLRSTDSSSQFKIIGSVQSNQSKPGIYSYSFEDYDKPENSTLYYKIKHKSLDGKISYSPVIRMLKENTNGTVMIFPNPAREKLQLLAGTDFKARQVTLRLVNNSGKQILSLNENIDSNQVLTIPVDHIESGFYTLLLSDSDDLFLKQKILIINN